MPATDEPGARRGRRPTGCRRAGRRPGDRPRCLARWWRRRLRARRPRPPDRADLAVARASGDHHRDGEQDCAADLPLHRDPHVGSVPDLWARSVSAAQMPNRARALPPTNFTRSASGNDATSSLRSSTYSGVWSACGKSDAHRKRSTPKRVGQRRDRALVRVAADPDPLAEVVARLVLQRDTLADERVPVHRVDAVEPVADPPAAGLEHDDLQARELVEHAVVEQRRELVAHAVGRLHRREQAQPLHVLPRAHPRPLRPLRLERRVDRERHVEVLGGGEHGVVVGMAERAPVVGERSDVAALGPLADGPLQLRRGRRRDR